MKTSSAKQKGRVLQQYVRDKILLQFPTLKPDDVRSTGMGQQGADIQLSPAARDKINWDIECKNLSRIAVYNYYDQARTHGEGEPIVVIKQNRSKPLVVVDLDYFLGLLK